MLVFGVVGLTVSALAEDVAQERPVHQPASQQKSGSEPTIELGGTEHFPPTEPASAGHKFAPASNDAENSKQDGYLIFGDGWAQWLMAATGIFALILSGWAVWLLKGTLDNSERAVKAAEDAVGETRRIGEAQSRAYIGAFDPEIKGTETESPTVIITIRNYGISPAHKVTIRTGYSVNFKGQPSDAYDKPSEKTVRGFDIGPGQTLFHPVDFSEFMWRMARATLDNNAGRLFVSGRINYEDVFGRKQFTRFRFRFFVNEETGIRDGRDFVLTAEGNESS